jgi:transcriptional regulator with XRE-family HTH domain
MTADDTPGADDLPERRVGASLREAREVGGLSMREMAKRLNYHSHTTLSSYERGAVMPTEQVVSGYEKVLNLANGTLLNVLERACVERHGDAWPKRRVHIPAEFVTKPADRTVGRRRARTWIVASVASAALGAAVMAAVFALPGRPTPRREQQPIVGPTQTVNDGADPKDSGCSLDPNVDTLDSMEVDWKGKPVGLIELRYSPECGVAWPRFEPFPAARIPNTVVVHTDVVRPKSRTRENFQSVWVGVAVYGNVLHSTEQCVYAAGRIETVDQPMPETRTHCFRGRTPDGTSG